MAPIPTQEGMLPFKIPSIDQLCFTYYEVYGDLSCGMPAVVILHGGPGAGHEYLLPFAELWTRCGLPVIFYDQIGCGSSTHLPHLKGNTEFWRLELFIDELVNLLDHFHLREDPGYHIFGQSWGGMLGADFATRRPKGLKRLMLANASADKHLGVRGRLLNRAALPPAVIEALDEGERVGDHDSQPYKDAMAVYNKRHLCNSDPPPPELVPTLRNLNGDRTVQETMHGPTVFVVNGSTQYWTVVPRLHQIIVPTLVYNGEFDDSHDVAQVPFFDRMPRVRWVTIAGGAHMCHLLEGEGRRGKVFNLVAEFLTPEISARTSSM